MKYVYITQVVVVFVIFKLSTDCTTHQKFDLKEKRL